MSSSSLLGACAGGALIGGAAASETVVGIPIGALAGCVGAVMITGASGCDDPEGLKQECDASHINGTGSLTVQSNGAPDVFIDGEEISVQTLASNWSIADVCPYFNSSFSYSDPQNQTTLYALGSSLEEINASYPTASFVTSTRIYAACEIQPIFLDPVTGNFESFSSTNQGDPAVEDEEKLISEISAQVGSDVELLINQSIRVGDTALLVPFGSIKGGMVGFVRYELKDHTYELLWNQDFPDSYVHFREFHLLPNDEVLLPIKKEAHFSATGDTSQNIYFSHFAFFDLKTQTLKKLYALPAEPILYEGETTQEGKPWSAYLDGLLFDYSSPALSDASLWTIQTPRLSKESYQAITGKEVASQLASSTLIKIDRESGEIVSQIRISILGPREIYPIEGTQHFAVSSRNGLAPDSVYKVSVIDAEGKMISAVDLPEGSQEPVFSKDGLKFDPLPSLEDHNEFVYEAGQFVSKPTPHFPVVKVGPVYYRYSELSDHCPSKQGLDEIYPGSGLELEDDDLYGHFLSDVSTTGFQIYVGKTRDYLFVDSFRKSAYYFQFPLDEPCYNFHVDPQQAGGNEDKFLFSCKVEAGGAEVSKGEFHLGYGTKIFSAPLPN